MVTNPSSAKTFEEFDQLQRRPFCERLERFLKFERALVEGGLVISLTSEFGTGKTAFLKMWENDLAKRREGNESLPLPILLNAWENDYCGDPMIAIASGLTAALESQNLITPEPKKLKNLWKAAEEVGRFGFIAANQIVTNKIGNGVSDQISNIYPLSLGQIDSC